MTKEKKALERLARDICWAGFLNPKNAGCTKLEYWAKVSPDAKASYRTQASHLLWLTRRLGPARIAAALSSTQEREP